MPYDPIQWARQSVLGRQEEADGSRLQNFYAVRAVTPEESKVPVVIYGTPGYRKWAQVPPETFDQGGMDVTPPAGIYGLLENNSVVRGNKLFGISSQYQFFEVDVPADYDPLRKDPADPLHVVPLADIHNFTAELAQRVTRPVHMVTDGRRILWVSGREVFLWDQDANAGAGGFVTVLGPVPDGGGARPALGTGDWVDCEWVDGYFVLAARSGQFFHSLLDSEQFDQLDAAFATAKPDEIVGIRSLQRRIYIFGSESIEQWANVGAADFVFRRDSSFIADVGCVSQPTIRQLPEAIFFLGSDRIVYAINGSNLSRVSTSAVEYDLGCATDVSQCRAFTYTEEGHRFYSLTIPGVIERGGDVNWTFDLVSGLWHERTVTGVYAAAQYRNRQYLGFGDQPYIYEQCLQWGDLDGQPTMRVATSPIQQAEQSNVRFPLFQVEIPIRPGGQDTDTIALDWSDDGKHTWRDGGRTAKVLNRTSFRWRQLGQLPTAQLGRNFRITVSAARRVDVLGAYIMAEVGVD